MIPIVACRMVRLSIYLLWPLGTSGDFIRHEKGPRQGATLYQLNESKRQ
jgi:hypothetical protein